MAQVGMLMSERMEEITMEETRMQQRGAISISCIKVEIHHTSGKFTVGAMENKKTASSVCLMQGISQNI
jgi:hypothetical protein